MPPDPITDEMLMHLTAASDRGCLEALARRHAGPLLAFLTKLIGDVHRAEELLQDVLLLVWRKRAHYVYPRPFKPWLYAIALNQCRAWLRGADSRLMTAFAGEAPAFREPAPDAALIADETTQLLNRAIDHLPAMQRAVLLLRVWQELPYSAIATALDCTEGTTRSHMHHALAALRKQLERLIP